MKNLARILLLLPGVVWGISFISVEVVLREVPPVTLTLFRSIISTVALLILCYVAGARLPNTVKDWFPFLLMALFNQAVPFALSSWAQIHIEAGLASIYLAVMPLFTVVFAAVFTSDEKLTPWKIAGVISGLIGIIILIGPGAFQGLGINIIAQLAVVGASLLYAIGAVYARFVYPLQPADMSGWPLRLRVVTSQFIMAIAVLLPASLILEDPFAIQLSVPTIWNLFFLGIGVTGLATVTYFFLIEELGAGTAAMTIYLIPITGVIAGVLILNEQFRPEMGIALFLILGGIAIINLGDRFSTIDS